jgi:putative intracellular protease/amidase
MAKRKIVFLVSIFFIVECLSAQNIKTLYILPDNFGANNFLMLEKFEEFGWDVTVTGVYTTVSPCHWGTDITVDTIVSEIEDINYYDCVVIGTSRWWANPPNAYGDLLNSLETMAILSVANDTGIVIYASCAGVRVLAAADIINGVNVTGTPYYLLEYLNAGANHMGANIPPVIDENIVTAMRSQYYFNQNVEAIKTAFENQLK